MAAFIEYTNTIFIDTSSSSCTYSYNYGNYCSKITETRKQKIDRIAKEKLLASHKVYNQKTQTIKQIKRLCKPQHRIYKK